MTIALTAQVNDGIVLATDSATTMAQGDKIINIYDNANKAFNLHKNLPIGAVTWGAGNIGRQSIASIVKDFRKIITEHEDLKLDPNSYNIQQVAKMFFESVKKLGVEEAVQESPLGFIISGYSANSDFPERWLLSFNKVEHQEPILLSDTGAYWDGQPEAINRLIWGFNPGLFRLILEEVNVEKEKVDKVLEYCWSILPSQLFIPSMPIQDVIDIAEFLIQTTIKYVKYTPGNQTVGGPIEIATITKHEGFKWIKRKYYYDTEVNPKEG